MKLVKVMAQAGVAKSNSEARRLIQQGAVEIDQKPVKDAELVDRFCSEGEGCKAREEFEKVFSKKDMPDDIRVVDVSWEGEKMKLVKIMAQAGVAKSNSEARRLIQQGAVEIDQKPVKDVDLKISAAGAFLLRVGKKRFVQVIPTK